jgi:glutaconate CoA-transferase subunit A
VIAPGFRVSAVVHAPWGGHPSPVPGHYHRDHQAFIDYRHASRTPEGFSEWRRHWVDEVSNPADYARRLGPERQAALRLGRHALAEAVDYGT